MFHDRPTILAVLGGVLILAGSLMVVLYARRGPGGVHPAKDATTPA